MPPLPLLRLPQLVQCEVFKLMNIGEIIKLSLCSTKVSIQINNARLYSQKVIVELNCVRQEVSVYSENNKDTFEIFTYPDSGISHNLNTHQFSIASCTVGVISICKGVQIFCKNHQEGYLSVIQHLLKMFQCKISTKSSCCDSDLFHPTILMLFDLQLAFKTLTISLHGSEDENLFKQLSNKFGLVEDLRISPGWLLGFSPVFTSWPQKITIMNSVWFTLEHLLACTCTTITLGWSHLENTDVDQVLRKWKAGGLPNLKYLHVDRDYIKNNRTTTWRLIPLELQGNVIQTDDGTKKATINTGNGRIEVYVTPVE